MTGGRTDHEFPRGLQNRAPRERPMVHDIIALIAQYSLLIVFLSVLVDGKRWVKANCRGSAVHLPPPR